MDTRLSKQVHNILAQRCKEKGGRVTKLLIARQNFDAAEIEFADMLMEDHNNAGLAYPDCTSSALFAPFFLSLLSVLWLRFFCLPYISRPMLIRILTMQICL